MDGSESHKHLSPFAGNVPRMVNSSDTFEPTEMACSALDDRDQRIVEKHTAFVPSRHDGK